MTHLSNRALQLACALALGGTLAGAAQAQQSESVPLSTLASATTVSGDLFDIDATYTVVSGYAPTWRTVAVTGGSYSYNNGVTGGQTQTWTFNKPVDLSFTIVGLNGAGEGINLPAGTRCEVPDTPVNHITYVAPLLSNTQVSPPPNPTPAEGAVQVTCQLAGASSLALVGQGGAADYDRGLFQLTAAIPAITSPQPPATGTVGTPYGPFTVEADDSDRDDDVALTYAATGLPPGVSIDPNTGEISGMPTTPGTYVVTIVASNGPVDSRTQEVTIVVDSAPVPPAPPTPVPTLDVWGLGALAGALGWLGLRGSRRRARNRSAR